MKLLIVEDDEDILFLLKSGFEEEGYIVDEAVDGEDGLYMASVNSYDIIILDWMLPLKDGIEVLNELRKDGIKTPTIMLTAKGEIKDKIQGLNVGADDYLPKPFDFDELIARVEALYRRVWLKGENEISIKNLTIQTDTKNVFLDGKELILGAKEYELLMFLVKNRNAYVSKYMLQDELWRDEEFVKSNIIEATIYKLRKKIGKDFVKNYKGLGYKIEI